MLEKKTLLINEVDSYNVYKKTNIKIRQTKNSAGLASSNAMKQPENTPKSWTIPRGYQEGLCWGLKTQGFFMFMLL